MKTIKAKIELYQQNGDKANYGSYKDKDFVFSYDKDGNIYNDKVIKFPTCGKKFKGFNNIDKVKVTFENGIIYEGYIKAMVIVGVVGTLGVQPIFSKGSLIIENP